MIAKGCSLRNPGDIASTGRIVVLKGGTSVPCRNSLLKRSQGGEAACQTELNVSSCSGHRAARNPAVQ
jgi:hypothetical protein